MSINPEVGQVWDMGEGCLLQIVKVRPCILRGPRVTWDDGSETHHWAALLEGDGSPEPKSPRTPTGGLMSRKNPIPEHAVICYGQGFVKDILDSQGQPHGPISATWPALEKLARQRLNEAIEAERARISGRVVEYDRWVRPMISSDRVTVCATVALWDAEGEPHTPDAAKADAIESERAALFKSLREGLDSD